VKAMGTTRIGVVSFEHMHANSYTSSLKTIPGVELVGIADDDQYRGTEMAARFGTRYYGDYRELLDSGLDGVLVCTCNVRHAEVTIAAAERGIHVLVEKPFAVTREDAASMLAAGRKAGVRIMTAFPLRFNQAVINAKRAVDSGEIGDVLCVTGINHGKMPGGWFIDKAKSGGGAVLDHTVHVADLMRWFLGREARSVYAESGELIHNKGIDDCGLLTVDFEGGAFGTIDTSWAHHANYPVWPDIYLRLVGTKGILAVDAFKQATRLYVPADKLATDLGWGSDGDLGLVREFVDVVRTGREPCSSGEDGAAAMEIALAAYRSSASHRAEPLR